MKFEWDERKNKGNILKHGISFETAAFVFSDINAISIFDEKHSESEDRWITIGKIRNSSIIVVIHTERIKGNYEYIRIISARKSDKTEIKEYFNQIKGI
jgi:uncharacterized DUF497 family protein